jgi:hypothetical protein
MDYSKFSSTSLVLIHAAEWQDHAKALEEEMRRRGVLFAKADFERGNSTTGRSDARSAIARISRL